MKAAKHTPGPWRVFNYSWSDTSILADGFDHGICLLDINHATEESQEADEAVMAANARLIAAAPDLLTALWKLRNEVSSLHIEAIRGAIGNTNAECLVLRVLEAEAAITKATGEQS
jgi:hypothetical protein